MHALFSLKRLFYFSLILINNYIFQNIVTAAETAAADDAMFII